MFKHKVELLVDFFDSVFCTSYNNMNSRVHMKQDLWICFFICLYVLGYFEIKRLKLDIQLDNFKHV